MLMLQSNRNRLLAVLAIVLILLIRWYFMSSDHLSKAIQLQEQILKLDHPTETELVKLYDDFGWHVDQLTPEEQEKLATARREFERREKLKELMRFFALSESERNAWLDAEIAKRAVNDAEQRKEERAAANLPPTSTFPGSIVPTGGSGDSDTASREVLDSMTAEERAAITEYERLYYQRLSQKQR